VHVVSQRLGHTSVVVTLTVYAHVLPGDQKRAATRFAELVEADDLPFLRKGSPMMRTSTTVTCAAFRRRSPTLVAQLRWQKPGDGSETMAMAQIRLALDKGKQPRCIGFSGCRWLPVWLPGGGQAPRHLSGSQFCLVNAHPPAHPQGDVSA
jgi:hypothetical protein